MKYVIIGNSAAGIGAVEGIRQVDRDGAITIISDEPYHTYSRPLISYFMSGKATEETIKYRPDSFYADNNCVLLNAKAVSVNKKKKIVEMTDLQEGISEAAYDKLLVATGSSPFVPPFEGLDTVREKFTFMSFDDAKALKTALAPDKKVLIVGAGLIGLKCAEGILKDTGHITIADLAPGVLSSILDDDGSRLVQKHLEAKGLEFRLGCSVKSFDRNKAVLTGGDEIDFDILVLAVGVRPNTGLLKGIAKIDRGILINQNSETSAPGIYAAGDCVQAQDISSGQSKIMALLPNAYMQGECAGINMAGGQKSFEKAIPMNAIGFFGLHVITAGNYAGEVYSSGGGDDVIGEGETYKRLFYSDNALNGYILIGNVDKAGIYTNLIRERTPLDSIDFPLICEKPGLMAFSAEERKRNLGGTAL